MPCSLNVNTTRAVSVVFVAASLLCASTASGQPTIAPPVVSYDSLMKLDVEARLTLFGTLTRDNKMDIVVTHAQRWILKNRARLSSQQITLVEEWMALVKEEMSGNLPKTQETGDRFNNLQRRMVRAFSWEDRNQVISLRADYIPTPPAIQP